MSQCVCVLDAMCGCVCCTAGRAGGSRKFSASSAKQPEGAETATGEDGQHSDRTDVSGESGKDTTQCDPHRHLVCQYTLITPWPEKNKSQL